MRKSIITREKQILIKQRKLRINKIWYYKESIHVGIIYLFIDLKFISIIYFILLVKLIFKYLLTNKELY